MVWLTWNNAAQEKQRKALLSRDLLEKKALDSQRRATDASQQKRLMVREPHGAVGSVVY